MSLILKKIQSTKIIVNWKSYGFPHSTNQQHPNLGDDEYKSQSFQSPVRRRHTEVDTEQRVNYHQLFPQTAVSRNAGFPPQISVGRRREKGDWYTEDICRVKGIAILHLSWGKLLKLSMAQLCWLQITWSWFDLQESANWVIQLNPPNPKFAWMLYKPHCQETPE